MARVKEMTARLVSFLIASKCPWVSIAQGCKIWLAEERRTVS